MALEGLAGSWTDVQLFGNSAGMYAVSLGVFLLVAVIFRILQAYVLARLGTLTQLTKTHIDDVIWKIISTIRPPFYLFLALYIALAYLLLAPIVQRVLDNVLLAWVTLQVVLALQVGIDFFLQRRIEADEHRAHKAMLDVLRGVVTVVLWVLGILFVLSNLGVNVLSLVAGLGIGGIAIALAAQNILSDIFNSLVIYFDQPFAPGDFIVVGKDKGTVQKVGLKTTRIKALSGEEIIIPNHDIAAARINNYKRLEKRRVSFTIAVEYETANDALAAMPALIAQTVRGVEKVEFDRAHFHEWGESGLIFRIVYFVMEKDFTVYMDVHQQILLGIKDKLEARGIKFAYSTRRMIMDKAAGK